MALLGIIAIVALLGIGAIALLVKAFQEAIDTFDAPVDWDR